MKANEIIAKILRIISVPPVMITALISILYFCRRDIFTDISEVFISIVLLGILPVLAYPLQPIIPKVKNAGRDGQRRLAFVFTFIGYLAELIYVSFSGAGKNLLLVSLTYFLSVAILTFCNKVIKIKASGHACSFTGPLVFLVYFIDPKLIFPCLLFAAAVIWSSVYLKRHTLPQLVCGAAVCLLSFAVSLGIVALI